MKKHIYTLYEFIEQHYGKRDTVLRENFERGYEKFNRSVSVKTKFSKKLKKDTTK